MTVEKYRSGVEMNAAPVVVEPGREGFDRFLRHCARYRRLARPDYPRGVFKFRSVEEMEVSRPDGGQASDDHAPPRPHS